MPWKGLRIKENNGGGLIGDPDFAINGRDVDAN